MFEIVSKDSETFENSTVIQCSSEISEKSSDIVRKFFVYLPKIFGNSLEMFAKMSLENILIPGKPSENA